MSTIQERRLARMPSAQEVVHSSDFKSPLAHVRSLANPMPESGDPAPSSLANRYSPPFTTARTQPIPALDFNLFRSNSVYSVSSVNTISSFDSTPSDEYPINRLSISSDGTDSEEYLTTSFPRSAAPQELVARVETPTTPKAERTQYFDLGPPIAAAGNVGHVVTEELQGGQITPKRSFFVRSRPGLSDVRAPSPPPPPPPVFSSKPLADPSTSYRSLTETHADVFTPPIRTSSRPRGDSVTREGEIAALHRQRQSVGPEDWESVHGEQGSEWGDDEEGFEWLDTGAPAAVNGNAAAKETSMSPGKRLAKLREAVPGFSSSTGTGGGRKLRKHPVVMPRRAAPPPPPGPGSPRQQSSSAIQPLDSNIPISAHHTPAIHSHQRRPTFPDHISLPDIRAGDAKHPPASPTKPTMMPLREAPTGPNPAFSRLKGHNSRNSGLSIQSTAFSLYDLDGGASSPSAQTPRASPGGSEIVFPKGTYTKIPAALMRGDDEESVRKRGISEPSRHPPKSPLLDPRESSRGDLLDKGVEARAKGDLPKAAWYFKQASDAGSITGRIYWGLALRHGWGVARDERKAFGELRAACDESIAHGSGELLFGSDIEALTIQQKKAMARDISLGMFEVANCFLEGVGVKKDPDVAISYLRFSGDLGDLASQEQLGFLLSKGGNGIKKDNKEAAKWYRMAVDRTGILDYRSRLGMEGEIHDMSILGATSHDWPKKPMKQKAYEAQYLTLSQLEKS